MEGRVVQFRNFLTCLGKLLIEQLTAVDFAVALEEVWTYIVAHRPRGDLSRQGILNRAPNFHARLFDAPRLSDRDDFAVFCD